MASSTQVISLINAALSKLGGGDDGSGGVLIPDTADLNNPSNQLVEIIAPRFDNTVQDVLASAPWAVILTREKLTAGDDPAFEFDHTYTYPSNSDNICLRLTRIWLDELQISLPTQYNLFELEGNKILTDYDKCWIQYVYYPNKSHASSNNSTWNTYFSLIKYNAPSLYKYLITALAVELAYQVVGSAAHEERLSRELFMRRNEAMRLNARQQPASRYASYDLIRARYRR